MTSIEIDILRALVILHGSAWQSDLMDTLSGLWRLKGLRLDSMIDLGGRVPKALKRLEELDLIEAEIRPRGDLSRLGPVDDTLYSAKGLWHLNSIISGDPLIHRYRREVMNYQSTL
ncbi:MAG: hypothetical protein ACUVQ8_07155 [Nitrososphaeria archaeon]